MSASVNELVMKTPAFGEALVSVDHWLMVAICLILSGLVIGVHYEALAWLNGRLPRMGLRPRVRILVLIISLLAVHTLEIWIYGLGLFGVTQWPAFGRVQGTDELVLLDAVYLSTVTYSTVGYGDLTPQGPLRLLLGVEALSGFLLVTWSASFTYLEMQRNWRVG